MTRYIVRVVESSVNGSKTKRYKTNNSSQVIELVKKFLERKTDDKIILYMTIKVEH